MDMATTMVRMEPESLHLRRACEGDPAAFTALVRLYDAQLRAYAYRLLRDRSLMDDALQNAYLSAYRTIGRFRGDASFKNWMYRIVHNACIDLIRKRRDDAELFESAAVADDPATARDVRLDLVAAFDRMTTEHRAVLVLIDVEGLDYGEAAQILSIPIGTVRSRLNRARSAMRDILGGERR
jgi:RNA polymerase sigma-70 factor (ECF subfamily)